MGVFSVVLADGAISVGDLDYLTGGLYSPVISQLLIGARFDSLLIHAFRW